MFGKDMIQTSYDILKGANATIWGGVENAEKVGKITKTGLSGADAIIGVDLALKDCARGDYFCTTLDLIGTLSTTTGMVLGNIPATKYGTFWGCTAIVGEEIRKFVKFKVKSK